MLVLMPIVDWWILLGVDFSGEMAEIFVLENCIGRDGCGCVVALRKT